MSRILKRQLKRNFHKDFDISSLDPKIQNLLQNVQDTYEEFDKERRLLENAIDISSNELYEANKQIRKKNEKIESQLKHYKQAMDTALLIVTFDLNNKITFVNDNFCFLSAYSANELIDEEFDFILKDENKEQSRSKIIEIIKNKQIWNGLIKFKSRDSNIYSLNTTIFPILNTHNEIIEYMSIFQDITAIEMSRQKALELDKAKSLFIANMSHELRTPLNSIIGFSQILKRQENIPVKLLNYIEKINFSGEHLLKLINSILDFSKIEAGETILEKVEINLYSIIHSSITQQEIYANKKGINLDIQYEEHLTKYFLGDSLRLTQIITNLISNALKFTIEGSVSILVRKITKNRIQIEVKDTGIGLTQTDKEKLFKEFSQADSSTSREYGGTGLGLSISKKLVQLMNGEIWVNSVKDEGSSFIFEINLEEVYKNRRKVDLRTEYPVTKVEDLCLIESKTILLVEDNLTNQFLVTSLLEDTKIKVHIANNGLEALNMVSHKKDAYDLILMDLQMPVMNGYEATIEIRKYDETIPIIALSANILKEDISRTMIIGMSEYLVKPIDADRFYSYLHYYLS